MNIYIIIGLLLLLLYLNKNYLNYWIMRLFNKELNKNEPSFCSECKYELCYECKALKEWENGKKDEAWAIFKNNEMFK